MKKIALFTLILLLVSACTQTRHNPKEDNLYITTKFVHKKEYENDAEYVDSQFGWFEVDTNDGKFHDSGVVTNRGGFSDGFVDADNGIIYYRDRHYIDDEKFKIDGDQIYSYNINTKEIEKLSDGLFMTNYVYKNKNYIYPIARTSDIDAWMLFEIDLETKDMKMVSEDEDYDIRVASLNPITEEIVTMGQSRKEFYEALDAQVDTPESFYRSPEQKIGVYKDGRFEIVLNVGCGESVEVTANQDYIIYYLYDEILHNQSGKTEVIFEGYRTYNRNTKETVDGIFGNQMESVKQVLYLSEDSSYMIAHFVDLSQDKIIKYTFDTQKKEEIFNLEPWFGSRGTVMLKLMMHEE